MITIFLLISIIIYIVLSWMIVYHLRVYTINKALAHRAIVTFVSVTIILVIIQVALFLRVETVAYDVLEETRTDAFGTF